MNEADPAPEVLSAAYKFVDAMVPQANIVFPFPAWHGWALRAAFIAGHAFARTPSPSEARPVAWLYENVTNGGRHASTKYETVGMRDWAITPLYTLGTSGK